MLENVFDYWCNCWIVMMNLVFCFLYWNMNYYVEYYMFLMVLFYVLLKLYEVVKVDMLLLYCSMLVVYVEIVLVLVW